MSSKRFSFRQSWDAIKYATELCQRSFESSVVYMSPSTGPLSIRRPHPARARESSVDDECSLFNEQSDRVYYTPSLYSINTISCRHSSTYHDEKIPVPPDVYISEYNRSSSTVLVPEEPSSAENLGAIRCASKDDIETFIAVHPLPKPNSRKMMREFRFRWFSTYRRLFTFIFVTNLAVIAAMVPVTLHHPTKFSYDQASTATGANLLVAILMRQEHIVNTLFRLACLLPAKAPLSVRKRAAKIYSYGGVHSGCGVSALLWYIFTVTLVNIRLDASIAEYKVLSALTATTLLLLFGIILLSHPYIRRAQHDLWEMSHRFGGWTAVALVWAQSLVLVVSQARQLQVHTRNVLIHTSNFWFLVVITVCIVYPWLRLRKRKVKAEVLSRHAIRLYFEDGTLPTCVGYKLSRRPLRDNHGFATISNTADEEVGYSIIVSNAGDFTKDMITNPPSHIYTRSAPVTGVMRVATLFQRIIIVATGSGIGPALSFMNVRLDWPKRVIWSARDPENTYGLEVVHAVLRADRRATIVDTKQTGYPDMPALTYAAYESFGAEAVMVVSNPSVTARVMFEMESRGVPAFGPIFDS